MFIILKMAACGKEKGEGAEPVQGSFMVNSLEPYIVSYDAIMFVYYSGV